MERFAIGTSCLATSFFKVRLPKLPPLTSIIVIFRKGPLGVSKAAAEKDEKDDETAD
jgi:hypothetical protein